METGYRAIVIIQMNVNGTLKQGSSTGVLRSSHILDILRLELVGFAKELNLEYKKNLPRLFA